MQGYVRSIRWKGSLEGRLGGIGWAGIMRGHDGRVRLKGNMG